MSPTDDPEVTSALNRMWENGGGATSTDFRRWQLSRAAVNRMLRSGAVVRSARGSYRLCGTSAGDVWQKRRSEHLMNSASMAGPERVLAYRSAALAWDLPVVSVPPRPELIRPPQSRAISSARVVRRALSEDEVTLIKGVPATTLERTAVDVALDLPTPQALITVDAALRRGGDRQRMLQILERAGSTRGIQRARSTVAWADGHAESALESRGRGELMVRGAPAPLCNVSFRLESLEFRVDLWWQHAEIAGEADGALKYDQEEFGTRVLWEEKRRQEWLEEEVGIRMLRFIDEEVRLAPADLYRRFVRKAEGRGATLWVPPAELEIFQRPIPGSKGGVTWLRRRSDG